MKVTFGLLEEAILASGLDQKMLGQTTNIARMLWLKGRQMIDPRRPYPLSFRWVFPGRSNWLWGGAASTDYVIAACRSSSVGGKNSRHDSSCPLIKCSSDCP